MSSPDQDPGAGEARSIDRLGVLTDLIDANWRDLHHSRNQDWKFWVTLGAIFGGLGAIGRDAPHSILFIALLGAGMMVGFVAAMISWNHTDLHLRKTAHIEWLESLIAMELGPLAARGLPFTAKFKSRFPDRWFVGGLIFSTYVTVSFVFAAGLGLVATARYTDWLGSTDSASIGFSVLGFGALVFVLSYVHFAHRMGAKRLVYARFFAGDLPNAG